MDKKLTIEFVRSSFEAEGCILLDAIYVNNSTKLNYICPQGHKHSISWYNWKIGHRCFYCSGKVKLSIEYIKKSFEEKGYTLLSTTYTNSKTNLKYKCSKGHEHSISWNSWQQGHKCPVCLGLAKLSIEFIKESFEKDGYTLLDTVYINSKTKLNYICPNGHKHSIKWNDWGSGYRCPSCYLINSTGQGSPHWRGGVSKRNVSLYDTYASQINFCEETRRDPMDLDILQVKCLKCNNWFTPTISQVTSRIASLKGYSKGENRFYCSDECKHSCSIYRRIKYSAEEKHSSINPNFTSEELKTWSKEVLKRANHICEYCENIATTAHHIQPKKLEPFFALDPDNGVACCTECHYKYGHSNGCSTGTLANTICS